MILASASSGAARPRTLQVDSGACLQPVDAAHLTPPHETFLRNALGLSDADVVVAWVVQPASRPARVLSLRRTSGGRRFLRVTELKPTIWAATIRRAGELVGSSVRLAEDEQLLALVDVALRSSTVDRDVDRQTADLLAQVWRALLRRVQVVRSDLAPSDGTRYEFWAGGRAGTSVPASEASVIGQALSAAERLARVAEVAGTDDASVLADVQHDLRDALARTQRKEPCVRTILR